MRGIPSRFFYVLWKRITTSISFLPVLISFLFLAFGVVFLYLEVTAKYPDLKQALQVVIVKDLDTARNILGILVGGVISLMVFSFSMVMLVLSQASTSLSPRIIPGLVSDKRHQTVLGIYLGTLLYLLLVMINLRPENGDVTLELNVLCGIILGVVCLCLFVYFIHTISNNIQVEVILLEIYAKGKKQIRQESGGRDVPVVRDPREKFEHVLWVQEAGYYNGFDKESLMKLAYREQVSISIHVTHGTYLFKQTPLAFVSKRISENCVREFWSCFYVDNQISNDHYYYNLKYISEIGVKALSPGLNDPETAIQSIHLLTNLLLEKRKEARANSHADHDGVARIWYTPLAFSFLLYNFFTPFRTYGKTDCRVMTTMLEAMYQLMIADVEEKEIRQCLSENIAALAEDVEDNISNKLDLTRFDTIVRKINELNYLDFQLPTSTDTFTVSPINV